MINYSLIPVRGARRRLVVGLVLAAVSVATGGATAVPFSDAAGQSETSGSYKWPVKPFDKQHPVRGAFCDPRTVFHASPTLHGVMKGRGSFSMHRGIDISAPNGAPVYPVMSGRVTQVEGEWVRVDSDAERAFEYWHIRARVRVGEQVRAYETVLGNVKAPAAHIHLTELHGEYAVNPLAEGRIGPYADRTTPRVTSIGFRRSAAGQELLPNRLSGNVVLVAGAEDDPTIDAPRGWRGLPTTPALLTWEIRTLAGKAAVKRQVAADFRNRIPYAGKQFWSVYARGTYQNMATFKNHFSYGQRGIYLFRLSPERFDTRQLRNGPYDLVVTATDIRGNTSSATQRFLVQN